MSQADGIGLIELDAFTTLVVRTDNSVYRVMILMPHAREVMVQGGAFFPVPTRACLSRSSGGGSCLKLGWVGVGLHLEFHAGEQRTITSRVLAVAVEPSAIGRPAERTRRRLGRVLQRPLPERQRHAAHGGQPQRVQVEHRAIEA